MLSENPEENKRYRLADVLILIILEDALWDSSRKLWQTCQTVLILIILEDALWDFVYGKIQFHPACLNPYYTGRCSLSEEDGKKITETREVLILIILEDALWAEEVNSSAKQCLVLILIILEDALWDVLVEGDAYQTWLS